MKTKILTLLLIIGLTFLNSCEINDDNSFQPPTENLKVSWDLKNINIPMVNTNIDYALGEVNWEFDMKNNILIVENNVWTTGPEDIYSGLKSGTYNFKIEDEKDQAVLFVDDIKQGTLLISNDTLTLDTGIDLDGNIKTFKRNTNKTFNHNYKGTFERNGITSNVNLSFNNGNFSGKSDTDKFPAICFGTYTTSENTIQFTNECVWTADFDGTLILNNEWNYSLIDNVLTLTKSNGDKYILFAEERSLSKILCF